MYACPKCGNPNTHVERRPDGFCYCPDCRIWWEIGERRSKPTVFDRITQSPEVLAPNLVFWEGGWTSRFITLTTTNQEDAIAATVVKLKEVYN